MTLLRLTPLALCLALAACNNNDDTSTSSNNNTPTPTATGSLTITPSLGKILNAKVILRQASTGKTLGTLNTGTSGTVTFNNIPLNVGVVEAEVKAEANSQYFDEATEQLADFTGSLHVAAPFSKTRTMGVTPLTEAAYQRAKTVSPTLTAETVNGANSLIAAALGIADITQAATLVDDAADLNALTATAADSYALLLAAIANNAQQILGEGELAPMLKAAIALAADATDGKIDGQAATGVNLPDTLPYSGTQFGQQLKTQFETLITSLNLPLTLKNLVNIPTTPPVDPNPSTNVITATGSITTGISDSSSSSFSPDSDGFMISVSSASAYTFSKKISIPLGNGSFATGTQKLDIATNAAGIITSISYVDFPLAGQTFGRFFSCNNALAKPCTGATLTLGAGSHPVTVNFNNTPISSSAVNGVLNGSLTGDMTAAAAWTINDLPSSTVSTLTFNGNATPVFSASFSQSTSGTFSSKVVSVTTASATLSVSANSLSPDVGVSVVFDDKRIYSCPSCATLTTLSDGRVTATINGATLSQLAGTTTPLVLNGAVTVSPTSGTLSTNTLGSFTPIHSSITTSNDELHLEFDVLGSTSQSGLSLLTVTYSAATGKVKSISAAQGIASSVYNCFETAAPFLNAIQCTGVTVNAAQGSVTFANTTLNGQSIGSTPTPLVLNGTVKVQGR